MIWCRECRKLSPAGSSFCIFCAKSFGGRRCPKGHLNPNEALRCGTCGTDSLSEPASSISFRTLSLVLSLAIGLALLRFGFSFIEELFGLAFGCVRLLFGLATGSDLLALPGAALSLALCALAPFLLAWLVFERGAVPSKSLRAYWSVLRWTIRTGMKLALPAGRLLKAALLGASRKASPARRTNDPDDQRRNHS